MVQSTRSVCKSWMYRTGKNSSLVIERVLSMCSIWKPLNIPLHGPTTESPMTAAQCSGRSRELPVIAVTLRVKCDQIPNKKTGILMHRKLLHTRYIPSPTKHFVQMFFYPLQNKYFSCRLRTELQHQACNGCCSISCLFFLLPYTLKKQSGRITASVRDYS